MTAEKRCLFYEKYYNTMCCQITTHVATREHKSRIQNILYYNEARYTITILLDCNITNQSGKNLKKMNKEVIGTFVK